MSLTLPFDYDPRITQIPNSPGFAHSHRSRRARRCETHRNGESRHETIADAEDISSFERWRSKRMCEYFGSQKAPPQDPRNGLPLLAEDTASTLARRYGASSERLSQALALEGYGLRGKARRLVLCGLLGHRIDHITNRGACHRKYFEPYFCHEKYCPFCGAQQFRELFAKLHKILTPVTERLIHKGSEEGRQIVIAKLDFTVPNARHMPTRKEVKTFHADLRRFWRAAERRFNINRTQYGIVRCDELGGDNTNLHCHCAYVGPWLPQRHKELSALWSKIRSEQSFVSIKLAKTFVGALAHALKYPAKFLDKSTPERLAALENTFHKTRRVSTGGAFYRLKNLSEPDNKQDKPCSCCPFCTIRLVKIHEQWQPLSVLEQEGRISLRTADREAGLVNALGDQPSP